MKQTIKALIARTGYRIVRDRGANRFEATGIALRNMKDRGFLPRVVVDGGAHLGIFSLMTKKIFPGAEFHLVEPQSACIPPLKALCAENEFSLHECALADCSGEIYLAQTAEPSTGAYIIPERPENSVEASRVAACTLDELFQNRITQADRTLLKMDLQGYELHALRGAANILSRVEVILTEASFFAQAYEPKIADLIGYLDARGFVLYDISALSGRTRDNRLRQGDLMFVRSGSQLLEDGRWE